MKAFWVTSGTNDVDSLVRAWDYCVEVPAVRYIFNHWKKPLVGTEKRDKKIVESAAAANPDVIFYLGSNYGVGIPDDQTFVRLREIAPVIHLCCDGGDGPWHPVLHRYKQKGCFDVQVTLDGHPTAPVDFVTVTPVDPRPWVNGIPDKTIQCGFSGNVSRGNGNAPNHNKRYAILKPLMDAKLIEVRDRVSVGGYEDHAGFMKKCRMNINASYTGSFTNFHLKGRVLESALARSVILELEGSPIGRWFPNGSFLLFKDWQSAAIIIKSMGEEELTGIAKEFESHAKRYYTPELIYGGMLSLLKGDYKLQ